MHAAVKPPTNRLATDGLGSPRYPRRPVSRRKDPETTARSSSERANECMTFGFRNALLGPSYYWRLTNIAGQQSQSDKVRGFVNKWRVKRDKTANTYIPSKFRSKLGARKLVSDSQSKASLLFNRVNGGSFACLLYPEKRK